MLSLRLWWGRWGWQLLSVGLLLGLAWGIRQSQGSLLLEIYGAIARPFQPKPAALPEGQLEQRRQEELAARLEELERQNQQLKSLLGYVRQQPTPPIPAPIVGRSPDEWWQEAILGRGSREGIQVGDAVLGIGGLVGRVTQVTPSSSRVLLLSNPNSRVGATVSRSRSMGYLQGRGGPTATVKFYEKVPDARPGDWVVTSSVSRLFPDGLPIGRIVSVNLASGPVPEAAVQLTAAIEHLEWVAVQRKSEAGE